jgi:hypothetical protein
MAITAIDLEETIGDRSMISRVTEVIEMMAMEMIASGKATEIETIVDETETTTAKLRTMDMAEITKMIEGTDQGEIEMIIEVGEMRIEVVMVETGVMIAVVTMETTTMKTEEDAEGTVVLKKTMTKVNQRKERFTFHQSNLMMKISCLEMMYRWE